MFPRITKHFAVGILAGVGLGLVIARTLAELRIDLAGVPGNILNVVGLVTLAMGWYLYRSDMRKSRAAPPTETT